MAAFPEFWYHPSVVNFTFSLRVIVPLLPALLLALSNAYESPYQSPITSAHFSINHSRHKRGRDCAAGRPITASQLPLNLSASTSARAWSVSSRLSLSSPPPFRPSSGRPPSIGCCVCVLARVWVLTREKLPWRSRHTNLLSRHKYTQPINIRSWHSL